MCVCGMFAIGERGEGRGNLCAFVCVCVCAQMLVVSLGTHDPHVLALTGHEYAPVSPLGLRVS